MPLPLDRCCRWCMVAVFLQPGEDDGFDVVLPIGAGTKDDLTKATAHHVPIPFGSSNCNHPDCIGLLASKTEDCLSLVCRVHQVAVAGTTPALGNPHARSGYLTWTYCKQRGLALIFERCETQVLVQESQVEASNLVCKVALQRLIRWHFVQVVLGTDCVFVVAKPAQHG